MSLINFYTGTYLKVKKTQKTILHIIHQFPEHAGLLWPCCHSMGQFDILESTMWNLRILSPSLLIQNLLDICFSFKFLCGFYMCQSMWIGVDLACLQDISSQTDNITLTHKASEGHSPHTYTLTDRAVEKNVLSLSLGLWQMLLYEQYLCLEACMHQSVFPLPAKCKCLKGKVSVEIGEIVVWKLSDKLPPDLSKHSLQDYQV